MRSRKFIVLTIAGVMLSACGSTKSDEQGAAATRNFLVKVASSDQFEIASSQEALKRSHDAKVKAIAQRMIDDHTKSSNDMKALLAHYNIPAPPAGMSSKDQATFDQLSATHRGFNKTYLTDQETAHSNAIALFQAYSQSGDNPNLRDFASQTLPTLRTHYQMIEQALGK